MVDRRQDWIEERGAGRSSSTIRTPILTRLWYAGTQFERIESGDYPRLRFSVDSHISSCVAMVPPPDLYSYISSYSHSRKQPFQDGGNYQMNTIEFGGEDDMRGN